jgi:hypothetical protein
MQSICSSFSPQGKALPGKPKGFDGGEVERYFREGKIKEVAGYCETCNGLLPVRLTPA